MCSLYSREPNILESYQEFVESTKAGNLSFKEQMMLAGLGLTGEAGEVADLIKKKFFHKHEIDRNEFVKEIGDVLWYLAFLANSMGIDLDECIDININKLNERYPNGFSSEASIARVDQNHKHNDALDAIANAIEACNIEFGSSKDALTKDLLSSTDIQINNNKLNKPVKVTVRRI